MRKISCSEVKTNLEGFLIRLSIASLSRSCSLTAHNSALPTVSLLQAPGRGHSGYSSRWSKLKNRSGIIVLTSTSPTVVTLKWSNSACLQVHELPMTGIGLARRGGVRSLVRPGRSSCSSDFCIAIVSRLPSKESRHHTPARTAAATTPTTTTTTQASGIPKNGAGKESTQTETSRARGHTRNTTQHSTKGE